MFANSKKVTTFAPAIEREILDKTETSVIIGDNARSKEDYEMFCKFWPKCIAKFLSNFYAKSEKSNKIN